MNVQQFISNYQEAFGGQIELPLVFWYSDEPFGSVSKINGCLFKGFKAVRAGSPISLNEELIGCAGGKLYTGYGPMSDYIPNFVSLKEKYKQTPEMVLDYMRDLNIPKAPKQFLNFARIDQVESFDKIEGVLFLATADVLAGLTTWAYFDNNREDAVSAIFGSGCSAIVTRAVVENQLEGRRTFLGLFDPSARPYFESNLLSFVIPMFRFKEMYHTMRSSCLFDTRAWGKIRERIEEEESH